MNTQELPKHLGGYQHIQPEIIVRADDILVDSGKVVQFAGDLYEGYTVGRIELDLRPLRVYRKLPYPRQGGDRPLTQEEINIQKQREAMQPAPIGLPQKASGLKDSGTRTTYGSGAQRDAQEGKGRFDLLPLPAIMAYAQLLEKGAKKYSERNWEKGIPVSRFFDGALRHLFKAQAGATDEDHLAAVMFNVGGIIFTRHQIKRGKLPATLDDMPEAVYTGDEF